MFVAVVVANIHKRHRKRWLEKKREKGERRSVEWELFKFIRVKGIGDVDEAQSHIFAAIHKKISN